MAVIELENITKSYGSFEALRGVNLAVREGEVTCVLGDNGAGKSTLIKILSGLHQPTSGTMLIDGSASTLTSPRDAISAGIATVHQTLAIVDAFVGIGPDHQVEERHQRRIDILARYEETGETEEIPAPKTL